MSAIKVQGETYDSAEEALEAAATLEAKLDELPESHPSRASLVTHIERLRSAAGEETPQDGTESASETEPAPILPGEPVPSPPVPAPEPEPEAEPEPEPEPEDSEYACPTCHGAGYFSIEPPQDPGKETCPRCYGYGKVTTGGHVEGHITADCPDCQGQGYIAARASYIDTSASTAAPAPGWPGAVWNAESRTWEPPPGLAPPWTNASWDAMIGTYK
jgi:hypothetical protein